MSTSIEERCSCGAEIKVTHEDLTHARIVIGMWREQHRHEPKISRPEPRTLPAPSWPRPYPDLTEGGTR